MSERYIARPLNNREWEVYDTKTNEQKREFWGNRRKIKATETAARYNKWEESWPAENQKEGASE